MTRREAVMESFQNVTAEEKFLTRAETFLPVNSSTHCNLMCSNVRTTEVKPAPSLCTFGSVCFLIKVILAPLFNMKCSHSLLSY